MAESASEDFIHEVQIALNEVVGQHPDKAVRYAAEVVPVYVMPYPTSELEAAASCDFCHHLGRWIPGSHDGVDAPHGTVYLFEKGITDEAEANRHDNTYGALVHELGHALNRDHVIEEMTAKGLIRPGDEPGKTFETGQPYTIAGHQHKDYLEPADAGPGHQQDGG